MRQGRRSEKGSEREVETYVGIAPLNLTQRSLHALDDRSLDLHHMRTEGLIHLNNIGFAFLEVMVDCGVKAVAKEEVRRSASAKRKRDRPTELREKAPSYSNADSPRTNNGFPQLQLGQHCLEGGEAEGEVLGLVREGFEKAGLLEFARLAKSGG